MPSRLRLRPSAVQAVDADTQKAMLAWYYKKQEEEKVSSVLLSLMLMLPVRPMPLRLTHTL